MVAGKHMTGKFNSNCATCNSTLFDGEEVRLLYVDAKGEIRLQHKSPDDCCITYRHRMARKARGEEE